ncbi:MAG: hypothetical protein ISS32_00755 [Candidatus Omnitrophica bacterium]|nr:hypothetical protein [Candidatus Omnitrophota bacterium]MBL7210296.1 hypothetical protein [Candidatus Omnitrophota bacterium]
MNWEVNTESKFKRMIARIPVFHRTITEIMVTKRAQENAKLRGSILVYEEDVIAAFFSDVPSPFYSMMIRLLGQGGFDYKKYGFPKDRVITQKLARNYAESLNK